MAQGPFSIWVCAVLVAVFLGGTANGSSSALQATTAEISHPQTQNSLSFILNPNPEDIPFFKAIAEDQDKKLRVCKKEEDCSHPHFLRGLATLYVNQELAAHHFRRVVVTNPNSRLATESRFWLWLLKSLNSHEKSLVSSEELAKRLVREMVSREMIVYELATKLENSSRQELERKLAVRDKKVENLKQVIAGLAKQIEELKKETALRQTLQRELKVSEKKVKELTMQLEALRRIDQEFKEKTPPTRPSEELTPTPELKNDQK